MTKWLLTFLSLGFLGATSLTGTLNLPNGTGATGTLVLSLAQQAALSTSGSCGGPVEVLPTYQVRITVSNGAMQGSPTVYGNDCLLPQGTYYNVQFFDSSGNIVMTDRWVISGTSINVGTIVSVVISGTTAVLGQPGVVLTQPSGSQTVVQPVGNPLGVNYLNVTTQLTLPNGAVCNAAGCSGVYGNTVDIISPQTITGQKTFTNSILFTGGAGVGSASFPAGTSYFNGLLVNTNGSNSGAIQTNTVCLQQFQTGCQFYLRLGATGLLRITDSGANQIISFSTQSGAGLYNVGAYGLYGQAQSVGQVALAAYGTSGQTADIFDAGSTISNLVFRILPSGQIYTGGVATISGTATTSNSGCTLGITNGLITSKSGSC